MQPPLTMTADSSTGSSLRVQLLALVNDESTELTWQHARELFRLAFASPDGTDGLKRRSA